MSDDDLSGTFGGWGDRLTYVLAEGQLVVLGLLFSVGAALVIFRPSLPSVPPIVIGWTAALFLFGPPLFGFWVVFVRRLRESHMIPVHHVDATGDTLEKYYVDPEMWAEKNVEDATPYPVNGGSGWAVQEFEHLEDVDELTVSGVWLSEAEDTKLLTAKSHMEAIYGKLTESHIALNVMRESVSEFGADIQKRVVNTGAEARERGTMVDESAVKDVFESFQEDIGGTGPGDLPTIELDDLADDVSGDGAIVDEPKTTGAGEEIANGTAEAVADD